MRGAEGPIPLNSPYTFISEKVGIILDKLGCKSGRQGQPQLEAQVVCQALKSAVSLPGVGSPGVDGVMLLGSVLPMTISTTFFLLHS